MKNRLPAILTLALLLLMYRQVSAQCRPADSVYMRNCVEAFSHDSMQGRLAGSYYSRRAARMIADSFRAYGLYKMFGEGFIHSYKVLGETDYNVIAILPGRTRPNEFIFLSAHYDHIGTLSANKVLGLNNKRRDDRPGDTVYNGANDNASGIAMLLSLARYYACTRNNARTICFVAFGGEELGLLGSWLLAKEIMTEKIAAMINFDMVGRFPARTRARTAISGDRRSSLRNMMNARLAALDTADRKWKFDPDPDPASYYFERCDNYPFALKGVPAHSVIATSDKDRFYHALGDEAETLDYTGMTLLYNKLILSMNGLISGADTPNRIYIPR